MAYEIERFDPCSAAVDFRAQFDTFAGAWAACPRGDWMLWIAARLNVDLRLLTLAKGRCAETVIHLMKDKRSRDAVSAAIRFGTGKMKKPATLARYAAAADDDAAAAAAAGAYAAAYAAYAAAANAAAADDDAAAADDDAAAAAAAGAYAAAYAAYAAAANAAAADDDAAAADDDAAAAKKVNEKQTADICRSILTDAVMTKIEGKP